MTNTESTGVCYKIMFAQSFS